MSEIYYRFEDIAYASINDFGEVTSSRIAVECHEYPVIKRTPKGAWIGFDKGLFAFRRLVLDGSRKRFACETKELARASFIARKEKQRSIHQKAVDRATRAIALVNGSAF